VAAEFQALLHRVAQRLHVVDEKDDAFIHGTASPAAHRDAMAAS
jgi:hypothetical protein